MNIKTDWFRARLAEREMSVPIKLHFNARGVATQTQGDKKMQAPFDTPKNAVAGQVRAPSSQFDGWLFVISPVHGEPAKSIDRLVVAKLGKELRLGVLRRGYEQESYTLLPLQGAEKPDDVVVDSARTVLWVKP